ncbi:alpha-protein kinase 2 [Elgaria multicarinata webbii]|uniref:alpha-protein kinase 2 n=1 Tax=Elgaria multicarinata webbii TaxID=159646 RepID=UPI002FCCED32
MKRRIFAIVKYWRITLVMPYIYLGSPEPPTLEFSGSATKQNLGTMSFPTMECGTCPLMENQHQNTHCSGDKMDAKIVLDQKENNSILGLSKTTSEFFIYDSVEGSGDTIEGEVNEFSVSQVDSKPASQVTDHTDSCCFNAEVLAACQTTEYAKAHEKGSVSKLVKKGTLSGNRTSAPLENQTCFFKDSPENAGSNVELRLDRIFATTDESFDDDLLEYFECSDVMTEEEYRNWDDQLKFLLESDDEEDELILGHDCDGCAYFLSEMPRLFQVSDNTMPIDPPIGFCGHQSKSKEVAVRSDLTTYSPSTLQAGMTLTVGQQQSKTSTLKDKEKFKPPVASMAIKNDYARIEEENTGNNHTTADVSAVRSQGTENGISETKSSSYDLGGSSATAGKRGVGRGFLRKNTQQLSKVRNKLTEGKAKVSAASPTKTSKDPLKLSHPKELRTSAICTVPRERSHLDSAAPLHREGGNISTQGKRNTVRASKQIGVFHGKGRDESGPWEDGKWISSVSEGNQVPKENATLTVEQQETGTASTAPTRDDLKLFIIEPELDERSVFTSSAIKSVSVDGENSASEKVSGTNGFQMDETVLENSAGLSVSNGTDGSDEKEPCEYQTLHIPTLDNMASCNMLSDDPNVTSKSEGLCDVLTPMAMPEMQTERGKANPHEVNEVTTVHDTPCAEYLSEGDFQRALESAGPELRDDDLSSMHEQLQKLLHEEEDWDYDFTCASDEVKSLAAGTDTAKEVRGLDVTGDVSAGKPEPGNLTEHNQLVTELAAIMKVHTDFNSLLKTDEACIRASMGSRPLTLPVETDAMCLCSAFGHKTEKPSAHLLRNHLRKEKFLEDKHIEMQPDHNESIQRSTYQEGMVMTDHAVPSCDAESPFRLTEAPGSPLERGQEILSALPTNHLGQLSHIEQNVRCTYGPIAKQADEMSAKESHITLCHSRIKKCASLAELSPKEDSSSNFFGKNTDQFTSEEHSSVTAVDKSAAEKFQEKGTESELNAQSGSNCGIYHILRCNTSKDVQAVSGAQHYSYHIRDHNSVIATNSKCDGDGTEDTGQEKKRTEGRKEEPVFTASYKVRFFTEVLLEINKTDKNSMSQEHRDFGASAGQIARESKRILQIPPSDTQSREPDNSSSITGHFCESANGLGLDFACFPPETCKLAALNTVPPSNILRNECSRTGQESQNASDMAGNLIVCTQNRTQQENMYKGCSANPLVVFGSTMQTEAMQIEVKEDKDRKALKPSQDQDQRVEEKRKSQTAPCVREKQMSVALDIDVVEVEPYMRALIDSEQIYSWQDSIELQQDEYQKVEGESQAKRIPCERDTRGNEESVECNLEEAEVEPYMRALINSEQINSWHDGTDQVHPSMASSSEQAGVSVGGLVGGCVITSTGHNQARAFTDGERQNLNPSERATATLGSLLPCASENSHRSEEQLPQVRTQPCASGATARGLCILKEERAKLQEASKLCKAPSPHNSVEDVKRKQETVKKKTMPKVQNKKPRLEVKENVCNNVSCLKRVLKAEAGLTHKEDKREQWKLPCKRDSQAPKLLKKIQAELFPDFSGNIKLCCQFNEIHEESTITWTKDSKLLARVHRSAGDDFPVSLAIVQAGKKDQGLYHCCLKNMYGKATAEFNLTLEVLEHLSSFQDVEGLEEIEFLQLMFREDFICDSYLSKSLHGRITTEEIHFGEGVHRKAFRSKVMQGLVPVFSPGHPCVLKVHNAIAYGTKNNDELVKKNYKLALQECYVQNTAREYAKIYAAETKPLEGFGDVPEIIPIFLIHRPKNNIPYATVEEELIGEFVKYSIRDGKEINFMRKDSEAGQKCCTFQHWVYERTSGSLLVTDMQGVGMKLTDVGIATLAKGYKGFKGNCSISFIDQFKALHQCNKYCEMLELKPLQTSCQKQRKPAAPKIKAQPSSSTVKKTVVNLQAAKKT